MLTIKAGQPLIELAKASYHANIPLLIEGRHGVGKSEILPQVSLELGIDCIIRDLSLMEPPDLIGLPRPKGNRTVYFPPSFLPRSGKGFLVFEELNRAPAHMRAPCLQLLTARTLNDYQLPPGWLPIAAINPCDEDYEVFDLDPALLSRFIQVVVEADREQWLEWATKNGIDSNVIGYAEADESIFDSPESNPRAWTYVSKLLHGNHTARLPDFLLQVAVQGLVGAERTASFFRYLKDRVRPLRFAEIFGKYPTHRAQFKTWIEEGKLDLVQGSLQEVMTRLQAKHHFDTVKDKPKSWKNLGLFLGDLPGDLQELAQRFFVEHGYPNPCKGGKPR